MRGLGYLVMISVSIALAACSSPVKIYPVSVPANPAYKVGKPYRVAGKIYRPLYEPGYDRIGLASWYGSKFHGRKTANGDVFDMNALTAAHTTLPMPSYVRVTNLENGRWLTLKINDRGPFVGNRLIDVSRRAAQLLGFEKKGVTRVRVQAVSGPQGHLPQHIQAQAKPLPPVLLSKIWPKIRPKIQSKIQSKIRPKIQSKIIKKHHQQQNNTDRIYIQVGAFADRKNALNVIRSIDHISRAKIDRVDVNGQQLYRVRVGPEVTVALAEIILGRILSLGHNTAHIIRSH